MSLAAVFVIVALIGIILLILGIKLDAAKAIFIIVGIVLLLFGAYGIFTHFL